MGALFQKQRVKFAGCTRAPLEGFPHPESNFLRGMDTMHNFLCCVEMPGHCMFDDATCAAEVACNAEPTWKDGLLASQITTVCKIQI